MIRRAFVMRLKPDALAEYQRHHDNIWPELVAEIERSGIASITTFRHDLELFLFSEIEDEAAWQRLWSSDVHQRWAQLMEPLVQSDGRGTIEASELAEIFHIATGGNGRVPAGAIAFGEVSPPPVPPQPATVVRRARKSAIKDLQGHKKKAIGKKKQGRAPLKHARRRAAAKISKKSTRKKVQAVSKPPRRRGQSHFVPRTTQNWDSPRRF